MSGQRVFELPKGKAGGPLPFPERWAVRAVDPEVAGRIAAELDAPLLMGKLLALRGFSDGSQARVFLDARLDGLHDPFLMKGMEEAVSHLVHTIKSEQPIGVYGDYDVDGISAASLLISFFRALGVRVPYYIPNRMREGYGLHSPGLEHLLSQGCNTVVTVDCGIASFHAVAEAARMGIHLIITDHHSPSERVPDAFAVLNPLQPGCGYPFKGLCGVGIAFKLATAVRRRLREEGFQGELPNLKQFLDFVALGTVADVVPLVDENHIFVRTGLEILSPAQGREDAPLPVTDSRKAGIRALQAAADLKADSLTAGHIGFVLAPRLNAAGRVGDPNVGVELLTSEDLTQARVHAERLEEWNRQRRELQEEAFEMAVGQLEIEPPAEEKMTIVLASDRWHPGVIGIVASKLAEKHCRPVVLIHLDGNEGKGSGRSVPSFHLYDALRRCSDLLLQFGGHKEAAGLSIRRESVDAFRQRFEKIAEEFIEPGFFEPELELDAAVNFSELEYPLVERLEKMAPFGTGNPQPVFGTAGVEMAGSPQFVGRDGSHLKLVLRHMGVTHEAIGFGMGALSKSSNLLEGKLDVAYSAGINRWRGRNRVQLEIRAMRPAKG